MITTAVDVTPLLRLLRPHQSLKSGVVAAPLFFSPWTFSRTAVGQVCVGMAVFCLVASAVYILNDYLGGEADRQHPVKRYRPLAAGAVSVSNAFGLLVILLGAGVVLEHFHFRWNHSRNG
jgi:decaprenyl-phosphate phosphoribosyltransferase